MSNSVQGNQKHLLLDNRISIEKGLDSSTPLRRIAMQLEKDPTTIAKEIKKHRTLQPHNSFNEPSNKCAIFRECSKKDICGIFAPVCRRLCKLCGHCNSHCSDFIPKSYHCPKLDKAPFVCNGCDKKIGCRLDKAYYRASTSQKQYKTMLIEARTGINISAEDLTRLDEFITPLILQGHSPYMILQNHPEIHLSEKTLYNYIDMGALSIKNIDLPKKVVYKVRSDHSSEANNSAIYEGRTYKDFLELMKLYPDLPITEMDTVVGCEGSHKVLLTLHFSSCTFMAAFLLDNKEAASVEAVFDTMDRTLGTELFSQIFPAILTDRGGEFQHPGKLECGVSNIVRTSIYFCDPMCSWQKPHCEKNHVYIRKICPKGTSFDDMTQEDITLMMSHINCTPRQSLGGLSPLALARLMLPKQLLDHLAFHEIPTDEIILTPELLKK